MQRSFATLVAAALLSAVSAQTPQVGIFYWCSFFEGGPNQNSIGFNGVPRTTLLGVSQGASSAPCHHPFGGIFPFINSDSNSYTYSNGTSYPTNTPTSTYAIAPTSCAVCFLFLDSAGSTLRCPEIFK